MNVGLMVLIASFIVGLICLFVGMMNSIEWLFWVGIVLGCGPILVALVYAFLLAAGVAS